MRQLIKINLLILLLLSSIVGYSQNFKIAVKMKSGELYLKAIPKDYNTWQKAKTDGLSVKTAPYTDDLAKATFSTIGVSINRPAPISKWGKSAKATAASELLNKTFNQKNEDFISTANQEQDKNISLALYLFITSQDAQLSKLSGLQFNGKKEIGKYWVKIYVNGHENDTNYSTIGLVDVQNLNNTFPKIKIHADEGEHRIDIGWEHEQIAKLFSSFDIEKATNKTNFIKLNSSPVVYNKYNNPEGVNSIINYTDTLVTNYQLVTYRVACYDYFGDKHYSQTITAQARDKTPPPTPKKISGEHGPSGYRLKWDIESSKDLDSYRVLAAPQLEGPFTDITSQSITKNTTQYLDKTFDPEQPKYYIVVSMDTAKNSAQSSVHYAFVTDTIPLAPPTGLEAIVDSSGSVLLTWKQKNDVDLKGFRVFKSVNKKFEFQSLTPEIWDIPYIVDSFNKKSLDEYMYYYVESVDRSKNHSKPSTILKVKLPDFVAPSKAILNPVKQRKDFLEISWIPSSNRDVDQYILEQKSEDTWQKLKSVNSAMTSIRLPVTTEKNMAYRLLVKDDDDNYSEPSNVIFFSPTIMEDIKPVITAQKQKGKNVISWKTIPNINQYILYKRVHDYWYAITELDKNKTSYIDDQVDNDTKVSYRLMAISAREKRYTSNTIEL